MPLGTPTRPPGAEFAAPMVSVVTDPESAGSGGSTGRTRSKGTLIGAMVGVSALVAAGAFAVVKITGTDAAGGAASPEEVGTALTTALDNEDFLGVIDLLLPGERDTFREPLIDLVGNLRRLELLSDEADLSKIRGLDIEFTDVTVRAEPTNVDDISNIYLSGSSTVSVDGDAVPLGDLLVDELFDGDRPDMDAAPDTAEFEDTKMTVVERDGRWYLSAFYSAAESARGSNDIPETGLRVKGADSPEGAVDQLLAAVSDLDLGDAIAVLDPTEAEALQRYAPLFLDDAQSEIDDVGIDWGITDTAYSVSGSGSRRTVTVDALTFDATFEGSSVHAEVADGCIEATADIDGSTEDLSWCQNDAADSVFEGLGIGDDAAAKRLFDVMDEALSDWEPGGISVHEVDGAWYVSPLRSYFDLANGFLGALDAGELRDIIDAGRDFAESVSDDFGSSDGLFDDLDLGDSSTGSGSSTDSGSGSSADSGGDTDFDAYTECFGAVDAAAGIACLNDGVAAGTIDPLFVPPHFRFPECGVAETYWSEIYSLSDAEFVAMAEAASPCFLDLVATGQVEKWEVASELLAPQCLEGKNWYSNFDDGYSDRFFECVAAVRDTL
jgi:hypothetical protein